MRDRNTEQYLIATRNGFVESFGDWKDRIEAIDEMVRGNWAVPYPDGQVKTMKPLVMNLMDAMPRDVARLVSETVPSINAFPAGDKNEDTKNALLREGIATTIWERNNGDILTPQHAMDLVITGTAFDCVWWDEGSEYPSIRRVDPRFCYPDVHNGMLQDLMVIQRIKGRMLERMYPDVQFGLSDKDTDEFYEIWEYYSPEECFLAASRMSKASGTPQEGGTRILRRWNPALLQGCAPVAFAQLPSPDGGFRGLLDQLGPSLTTRNRVIQYLMDYSHQMVYAPWESKGILNNDEEPGPDTDYIHDPDANESFKRRVSPASPAPALFSLLSNLDNEERAQAAYPSSRQGEVSQSIASAAFVASTQGQLTSVVRDIQRLLGEMREKATSIALEIDERYLNFEKPLIRPVARKKTYVPGRDIKGQYDIQVVYGSGAGLDRQSADVRNLQYYGNGIISKETVLQNTDFVADAQAEIDKRQTEELDNVILQRFGSDPSITLDFVIAVNKRKKDKGISLVEALEEVQAEQAPQPTVPEPGAAAAPGGEAPPGALETEKGAVPAQAPAAPQVPISPFTPPPLSQVFVR